MKTIYKYGTGQEIPEGAVYLSTQTEPTVSYTYYEDGQLAYTSRKNTLVWHYFLVEVEE